MQPAAKCHRLFFLQLNIIRDKIVRNKEKGVQHEKIFNGFFDLYGTDY